MQIQQHFSWSRFFKLFKLYWYENGRMMLISLAAFSLIVMIILFLFQIPNGFSNWDSEFFMGFFILFYIGFGLLYSGHAFPAFRKKESTINYLILPTSILEKYLFELITRILLFVIIAPILYWILANVEGAITHFFFPSFENYQFRWSEGFKEVFHRNIYWEEPIIQLLFLVIVGFFIIAFTGASSFRKNPLLKSILIFGLLFGSFILLTYLLTVVINITQYRKETILFLTTSKGPPWAFFFVLLLIPIIGLSTAAYYKLKEKEV